MQFLAALIALVAAIIRLYQTINMPPAELPKESSIKIPAREHEVALDFEDAPGRDRAWPGSYLRFQGDVGLKSAGKALNLQGRVELVEWDPVLKQPGNDATTFAKNLNVTVDLPAGTEVPDGALLAVKTMPAPDHVKVIRDFHVYELPAGKSDVHDNASNNGTVSWWKYDGDVKKVYFRTPEFTVDILRKRTAWESVVLFVRRFFGLSA